MMDISTGKIMKIDLGVLERGHNFLRNDILNFEFRLSQSTVIAFQSWKKQVKGGLAVKGLNQCISKTFIFLI